MSPARDRRPWNRQAATLALLAFAMLIVSLDQYIVVVALPEIGRELGYSPQTLQSVISAYAVASAGFLLLGGRAADLIGRRRILVSGLALYAGASLAGGLATVAEVQLGARAVQGLGGALVFPATLSLVNTTFAEGRERNRALAVWGGAGAAGLVVGVLLGGVLTQALGWEAVFFVNVPLAGLAILLAFPLIAADRKSETSRSSTCRARSAPRSASPCSCSPSSRVRSSGGVRRASSAARQRACSFWQRLRRSSGAVATRSCRLG